MPIFQTTKRIDPLDLQKNIAIGVSLPFNRPFNSTYSTKDQIKSNLINLLLTNVGERIMNPFFGSNLRKFIFEGLTNSNIDALRESVLNSIEIFIPEVTVDNFVVSSDPDNNFMTVSIYYSLKISKISDQVILQFT